MDDEEIRKLWLEIQDAQKHPDVEGAAIRLYRTAEANIGLEYEKLLLKQDINCNQLLKQARADEREKAMGQFSNMENLLKEAYAKGKVDGKEEVYEKYPTTDKEKNLQIMSYDVGYSEGFDAGEKSGLSDGYKKGKVDGRLDGMAPSLLEEAYLKGQRSKTAYELGKGDGMKAIMDTCEKCRRVQYGRGQTDLIEKLKAEMTLAGWHQGMSIHQEHEMGDYRRGQLDVMHWLERRASESLGAKGSVDGIRASYGQEADKYCKKPSHKRSVEPANPKNACKHKNIESEISNGDVAWNCQDCGESHNWEETKPEKPKYPIKKSYSILHSNKSCGITHAINCVVCDCSCHDKPKGLAEHAKPNKEQTKED